MKNTNAYLINRVKTILRTETLEPKDLSLDMLMTAYASVHEDGDAGNDQRITMKVPALATYYAKLLEEGKFVVINDVGDNRWYFVKAHEHDLIAVSFSIGPWLNVYTIKSTSEDTLKALNITTPKTSDLKIIDRIFGFRPLHEDEEDREAATVVVTPDEPSAHWRWHTGNKPAKRGEDKSRDTVDPLAGRTETVTAPAHVVESTGVDAAAEGAHGNQMERAFASASQHSRSDARQHDRDSRRQHDQRQSVKK